MPTELKLIHETSSGRLVKSVALVEYKDDRIEFIKSPFALKDEIKAMQGSKWHGYIDGDKRKIWSISDCPRNRFQLGYLQGEDVYAWFEEPIKEIEYDRPLKEHQRDMANICLTRHFQVVAGEMGVGKTLVAQEVIERSQADFWWTGPKTSLPNMRREFKKWGYRGEPIAFMTYDELIKRMEDWKPGDHIPRGLVGDEISRCKNSTSYRSIAMQRLADLIRETYGFDGYVILMSGTPSPKTPVDWWSLAEIAWPGFLKEGSPKALEHRVAFMEKREYEIGRPILTRTAWKDDANRCAECGRYEHEDGHDPDSFGDEEYHKFVPSINEVALLHERLKGLVTVKLKKDCLDLPDKRYRKIICKPSSSVMRVAKVITQAAPNAITAATLLRELSDGFQYKDVKDGVSRCSHCWGTSKIEEWFKIGDETRTYRALDMLKPEVIASLEKREIDCPQCEGTGFMDRKRRESREVPCPKQAALEQLLDECEENGRIVIFAGFTGSVDRCIRICQKAGWTVVRCDGRGYVTTDHKGETLCRGGDDSLAFWADRDNPRVAFVAQAESGGMSLTLTESRMAVYWSNTFKPEYRVQSEDRIHRMGMDENLGCDIVDLLHLPCDERVLEVLRDNRRIELMTLGEFSDALDQEVTDGELLEIT